jgi:hypothetical protein
MTVTMIELSDESKIQVRELNPDEFVINAVSADQCILYFSKEDSPLSQINSMLNGKVRLISSGTTKNSRMLRFRVDIGVIQLKEILNIPEEPTQQTNPLDM